MATVDLTDLVVPATQPDALSNELSIGTSLGLPTTAWQPLGIVRDILWINAQIVSNYSSTVALIAQGGYLSLAIKMVDQNGNPITAWADLVGQNNYNVTRIAATFAAIDSSGFSITSTQPGAQGPFAPGQLHVENPTTGATYHNSSNVTVLGNATTPIAIIADVAGAASTSGPGTITDIVAPTLTNCTCTNSKSVVGFDAESNAAYGARCLTKLGTLSAKGPSAVYYFVATSITDPTQPWYNPAITTPITRVQPIDGPALIEVYIANASGAPSVGDVAIVNAAIQAWAVPSGTTAIVQAATPVNVNITYTVFIPAAVGLTVGAVESAISTALAVYFESLPIGGVTDISTNVVPYNALVGVIYNAVKGITSVTLTVPSGDVALTPIQVAQIGTITPTVVLTS